LKRITSLEEAIKLFEELYPGHEFNWQRGNGYYLGKCPFHPDSTPSLSVRETEEGIFYNCFGCGKKGRVERLLEGSSPDKGAPEKEESEGVRKALSLLVEECHKELLSLLPSISPLLTAEELVISLEKGNLSASPSLLFKKLGLDSKKEFSYGSQSPFERFELALKHFQVGIITRKAVEKVKESPFVSKYRLFEREGWLVFPYYSLRGRLEGVKFRNIASSSRESRELRLSSSFSYFGGKNALIEGEIMPLFAVEGETDALSLYCDALSPVIAVGSVSRAESLIKDTNLPNSAFVLYFPDYDPFKVESWGAGREVVRVLLRKRRELWKKRRVWKKLFIYCDENGYGEGNKDICDGLKENTLKPYLSGKILELSDAYREIRRQHEKFRQEWAEERISKLKRAGFGGLAQAFAEFVEISPKIPRKLAEVPRTPIKPPLLGIYPPNKVSLVAGQGGTGKTTFCLDLCCRSAVEGKKTLFWTTEHSEDELLQITDRIIASRYAEYEEDVKEMVSILDCPPQKPGILGEELNEDFFGELEYYLRTYDAVFLDPLISFLGVEENKANQIRHFFDRIHEILTRLKKEGLTRYLIILLHTNKLYGEEFKVYNDEYEDTKTKLPDGRVVFRLKDLTKVSLLLRLIRGHSAIYDAARYVELLLFSSPRKKKGKGEVENLESERIVITVKSNFPSGRHKGEGEVIPNLLSPPKAPEETEEDFNFDF